MTAPGASRDFRVGGQAGDQFVARIFDVDPDAIDERHALGMGLDAFRREFGLREMNEIRPGYSLPG